MTEQDIDEILEKSKEETEQSSERFEAAAKSAKSLIT